MKYIKKILLSGEDIIYVAKVDWIIFLLPISMILIGILSYVALISEKIETLKTIGIFGMILIVTYYVLVFYNKKGVRIIMHSIGVFVLGFIITGLVMGLLREKIDIFFEKEYILGIFVYIFIFAFLIAEGLIKLIKEFFYKISTELVVTSKRILFKTGFIKRHTVELTNKQIESLSFNQSILGRILNFGDINIYGIGGVVTPIYNIDNQLMFRKKVVEVMD